MNTSYRVNNNDIFINSSIGYAMYPEDTEKLDKLISYADIAMYEGKVNHLNRCIRFTKSMYDAMNKRWPL